MSSAHISGTLCKQYLKREEKTANCTNKGHSTQAD